MSKLITHIKRLALALCLATPFVSRAVTTTGYGDFGDTAGVVLWRGPGDTSGKPTFHNATVIDVAADGTLGTAYTMDANNGATSWQRFSDGTTAYSAPGKVLVYDEAGYGTSADAQFGNFVFGGLWVKTLAAESTPYSLVGAGYVRTTYFGADNYTTYFKVEKSYTVNRDKAATFRGTANVEISDDAVFTIHKGYSQTVSVPSGAKLVLTGGGTLAVSTLSVAGTLDISAETVPAIDGNVTLAGDATIVVPAGTTLNDTISLEVCSGTLSANGLVYVKVGDAEPQEAELTISGGTITEIATEIQTEQTFTSDYPSVVPFGFTYTYVATEAVTIPAVTVNGTLKTSGPITISNFAIASGADFEVVAGNTTVGNGGGTCQLKGNITVDAGATLTNTKTDTLDYNGSMTVDVYGTLAMGATRWSVPGGCTFKLRNGAQVTGAGDSHASLDFINGTSKGIDVYGSATVEGKIRVRANETRIWVNEGATLVLSSGIADGGDHHGGFKQVGPGTLELHANSTGLSGNASVMTQGTLRLVDTTLAFPVSLQGNSSYLEVVATEEATTVPVNVTSIANNNVTFSGAGKVNGSITKTSAPSGNLATALQSAAWTGTFVADWAGNKDTRFDINSYGNANSVVEVTQLAGGYVKDTSAYFYVVPTVNVSGTMTLNNGFTGTVTVFPKLTGSGTVTINTYPVTITMLDKFTGTFNSNANGAIEIGTINLAATPEPGDKIVSIGSSGSFYGLDSTKVAVEGVVDSSFTGNLEKKSDGIYVAVPVTTVDITITPVTGATASVTADGQSVEIVDGKVTVDIGAEVSVTYTATAGYVVTDGTVVFTATADTTAVDTSSVKSDAIVAVITDANSDTWSYTDLATAFSEVDDGDTLTLYTDYTLTENVEVSASFVLAGNAGTGTVSSSSYHFVVTGDAEFTIADSVTVGAQVWIDSTTSKVKISAEATTTVRNSTNLKQTDGYIMHTSTEDGVKTIWIVKQYVLNTTYNNCAAYIDAEHETPLGYTPVDDGSTVKFVVVPNEGYESPTVVANDTTIEPDGEGWYSVTVDGDNVNIVVSATIKTFTLTVPEVENATATVTVSGVPTEERTFDYGTVVTVTYTPATYYSVTANGNQEITMTEDKSAVEPTVVRNTVTVTVPSVKNATATATIGGEPVALDANGQAVVSEGFVVTVTYAANEGYDISGTTEYTIDTSKSETTFSLDESTKVTEHVAAALVSGGSETTYKTVVDAIYGLMACAGTDREAYVEVRDGTEPFDAGTMASLATYSIIYDATDNAYRFAVAVIPTGVAQQTCYPTLDAALEAAEAGQTVRLYRDVVLTTKAKLFTISKSITLDLGGRSIQRLTTNNYVLVIPNGFEVTIKDTSSAGTGFIKGTPVTATGKVASLIQVKGTLTLESGSLISDYNCVKVDEDPGVGTFVMNGGTLEIIGDYTGRTYALMNWGSATINDGTINGNLWALADNSNKVSKEGTLVVNGGTFQTAVLKLYVADDETKPTIKVASSVETVFTTEMSVKDGATVNWQLAEPTVSEGYTVYTLEQKPAGIDPTDPESKQEVTPTAEEIEAAGGNAAEAAKEAAEVTVPDAVSGAVETAAEAAGKTAEELYKSYFKLQATETSEGSGVYNVTIADLKEEVKESVSKNAVEELVAAVEDTQAETVTVAVPAGLYYKVETFDTLGGKAVDTKKGLSTGATTAVDKPTDTTQGFIRVTVGPAPIQ